MTSTQPIISVTEKYINDMDCMRSYAALREKLFYNQTLQTSVPLIQSTIKKLPLSSKNSKVSIPIKDYSNDESVIMAIQNDTKFINIIMNCRKQKSTLAYIFVESEYNYITCIIKIPDSFPLMLIRLPINKKFIYAKSQVNNCYEFPLVDIISKDIKFNKSSSYSIVLKYNGKNVQFIYDIYNASSEPNRIIIDSINVGGMNIIDNLFNNMFLANVRFTSSMNQQVLAQLAETPSLLTFDTMNVLIVKESNNINTINFNTKQSAISNNYFRISDNQLTYISETNKKQNEIYICSQDDSIWWNINDDNIIFTISSFDNLFKINYNRSVMQNDRIYYVFTSFMNNYMFIKVITSLEVSSNNVDTFIKTFSHEYQIVEAYMCMKKI